MTNDTLCIYFVFTIHSYIKLITMAFATMPINPIETYHIVLVGKNNKESSRSVLGSRILETRKKLDIEPFVEMLSGLVDPETKAYHMTDAHQIVAEFAMGIITVPAARKKLSYIYNRIAQANQTNQDTTSQKIMVENVSTKQIKHMNAVNFENECNRTSGKRMFRFPNIHSDHNDLYRVVSAS
ncbi:hypothetical protein FK949_gp365 [Paramecium bursaria Chlorella virus NYs1]|uniref:Uncharacterized protein n=1 Tax=Paramecium bursaria Chlorella virus NYs1 TaxID=83442 RepID=M1IJT2_9PHYC|nr:hypothetical protein AR158_C435R [Paramecium bursaria Chlorella virus AR158]YP_009665405.1 hypothetical protein FK949_gp365 [Paramecium bursaria Chlorella virus NYs1]ABU43980.1 hypothetical protein AR158_C435R [Paramecium bursaria Chlorella virus AR158]AGE54900.1 hypothetical protein PBCVMA1D_380R [Paramecium bursaria Chlorella virus MA1D]AGE58760.1 hypothetical protein PBCVNYs1_508R [Paramecium bursaria Chlorella virus NYs1]